MRMGSCGLFMNSNRHILFPYRKSADGRCWKDASGYRTFWNFPYHSIGMYSNDWCGFRVNGRWHTFINDFYSQVSSAPQQFSCDDTTREWSTVDIVGAEISTLGVSTEHSVFDHEQSRIRKYSQPQANQVAFYEPALKLQHRRQNFSEFCIFPV